MPGPKKSSKTKLARGAVRLDTEQYRSMILDKLRKDIEIKRSAFDKAIKADLKDLANMSYWKMKYWKMKYWKKGHDFIIEDIVSNPVMPQVGRVSKKSSIK